MDSHDLVRALHGLDMSQRAFARWTGVDERTVRRWCHGQQAVARWVEPMVGLMALAVRHGERPWAVWQEPESSDLRPPAL